jgi:hypothetical protein
MSEEWEAVFSTVSQVEAQIVRGLLETNGFTVLVRTTGLKQLAFIYGDAAIGEIILLVPPSQVDEALGLLSAEPEPESEV